MSLDPERDETLRTGIAAALGRLRGDVIPLPVAHASVQSVVVQRSEPQISEVEPEDELRADPDMKTGVSGEEHGLQFVPDSGETQQEQPDLLSGLEPPQLMPPLTDEERANRNQRRRRRRMLVAACFVAVCALIGGYLIFGGEPEEVPLITADQSPEKVKPTEEGGLEIPNQDIAILQSEPAQAGSGIETVLPAPEQPMPAEAIDAGQPSVDSSMPDAGTNAVVSTVPDAPTAPQVEELAVPAPSVPELTTSASGQTDGASQTEEQAAVEPAPIMPAMPAVPEVSTATQEAALPPAEGASAVVPEPLEAAASQSDNPAAQAALSVPEATVQAALVGDTRVQLAAVKSEEAARAFWAKAQSRHSSLLSGLELTVEKVDKGADGIFYRVQAGPLADRAAGKNLCAELKKENQDCIVVK